ncbi:MAG TPA: HAMP domain-containing sensor histidine kinase, partial [Ktedonobacteraceae bacterium]
MQRYGWVEEENGVLVRTYFHHVARSICELIGCGAVLLALHCPEADMGHPLLQWLPTRDDARLYGAIELLALFEHERVRALRDIACQSGQVRFLNERLRAARGLMARSVAIAPLLYPSGVAGYFVLADAFAGGFTPGDARLLGDYLRSVLPEFESNMRALCGMQPGPVSGGPSNAQHVFTPVDGTGSTGSVMDSVKHDLISMVGHELRAPLTAIKGYAALLQTYSLEDRQHENGQNEPETTITPARQQSYLDIIMDQAGHLELLMNDLLDVSRIQAGKLALRYTEVDVGALCQQIMRLARQRIDQVERDQYILRCEVSPELPSLQTDASRLQQILHNLLDNAIKYSPGGGVVELHASMKYETQPVSSFRQAPVPRPVMRITVCDQGIGINARQRERLFQPFSRLDHAATGQVQGTGLGLY